MAKKKYHQSVKDRMAESRGMERYETMKSEDMMPMHSSDHANMPQDVKMHYYKDEGYIDRGEYADTYSEKNREYDHMIGKIKGQLYKGY